MFLWLFLPISPAMSASLPATLSYTTASDESILSDRLVYSALSLLGYDMVLDAYPMRYAIEMANSGERDGLIGQIGGLNKEYSDLVMVPETIGTVYYHCISLDIAPAHVSSWEELSGLKVGVMYQKKYILDSLPKDVAEITQADTYDELFTLLRNGTIDVVVLTQYSPSTLLIPSGFIMSDPIDSMECYTYLNKRYGYLAGDLAIAIKTVKENKLHTGSYLPLEKERKAKTVYHISSYYPEDSWDAQIVETLKSNLTMEEGISYFNFPLYSNHYQTAASRARNVYPAIRTMLVKQPADLIIISDNNALGFLNDNYDILFAGLPVVFMDIDSQANISEALYKNATGIRTEVSAADTVSQALSIYPNTQNLFVINDVFSRGTAYQTQTKEQLLHYTSRLRITYNRSNTLAGILEEIAALPDNTIILIGCFGIITDDIYMPRGEIQKKLCQATTLPVFSLTNCGDGEIGGCTIDPRLQAASVANMAKAILSGIPVRAIPEEANHTLYNTWTFDDEVIKARGISTRLLPATYEHLNGQVPFYEDNPEIFGYIAAAVLLALGLVTFLIYHSASESLKSKERLYNSVKDIYIFVNDPKTYKLLFVNDTMRSQYHIGENYKNQTCYQVMYPGSTKPCAHCHMPKLLALSKGQVQSFEQYMPSIDAYLKCTDQMIKWSFNKDVHLQVQLNITKEKKQADQQQLISTLSQSFIQVESAYPLVTKAFGETGPHLGCDGLGLFIAEKEDKQVLKLKSHWLKEALPDQATQPSFSLTATGPVYDRFKNRIAAYIAGESIMQMGLANNLGTDTTAFLMVPVYGQEGFLGILGAAYFHHPHLWAESEIKLLDFLSNSISTLLHRKKIADDLIQANENAQAANQAKTMFLSNMSHELRTPLNAITGMTKLASQNTDPLTQQKYFSAITIASSQLLTLINSILDIANLDKGTPVFLARPFNLPTMLSSLKTSFRDHFKAKEQTFHLNIENVSAQTLLGDESKLTQIISCLVSNAIKFTPVNGSIVLNAAQTAATADTGTFRFSVTDSGIGLNPEALDRVFGLFEMGDNSNTRAFGGAGAGLSMAKELVERMGGRIWAESQPGEGATFSFEITLGTQSQPKNISISEGKLDLSKLTLLLAEDIEVNRDIFVALLEDTGIHIHCAFNGQEAVTMYQAAPESYDIIIMDIQMPVMNGYDATLAIRQSGLKNSATIPIIAMTANAFKSDIEQCLAAGMNDHLEKPINLDLVLSKILRYTRNSKG